MTALAQDRLAPSEVTCGGLLPVIPDREDAAAIAVAGEGVLGAWITRAELRARISRLAAELAAPVKGLVFVLARNDLASLLAFLAAREAGHAVALLDAKGASEPVAALVQAYDPEMVLGGGDLGAHDPALGAQAVTSCEGVTIARRATHPQAARPGDALAVMLSTSGTTGSAKFVRLSEAAVLCNARQIAQALHIGPSDVGVGHLAFHYSYGMSVLTSHLVSGAAVVLMDDSIMSPTFWATVAEAGGTHFPGVPFHYTALARLGLERLAPASVKTFTQAGGALDMRFQRMLHEQAAARGAGFYVMYGQTEAGPRISTLQSADFEAKAGSVGTALDGGRLTVVDDDGVAVAPGSQGHVIYTGPNVMLGYATRRADLSAGDEQAGRLATGDLGYVDADGFLFLTGRSKRISKVYGLRISLDEIEARLGGASPLAAVDAGERIVVFHEPGADLSALLPKLAEDLGLPSAAFRAKPLDALPRLASGKTDYGALKDMI